MGFYRTDRQQNSIVDAYVPKVRERKRKTGSRAGYQACLQAVMTLGGMGYSKEYHVKRLLREVLMTRIAPISDQMILNFISERVLELPRSY